jgi:hypothetical protein
VAVERSRSLRTGEWSRRAIRWHNHAGMDEEPDAELLTFDAALAESLIGKRVLVGITYENRRGEMMRTEQVFGTVSSADPRGIRVALDGVRHGETKWLPPSTGVFRPAPRGEYRLRSTGEVVVDPDFTAQWTVKQPDA